MTFFLVRMRNFRKFQRCKQFLRFFPSTFSSVFFFNFFINCSWHFYGFCFALFGRLSAAVKLFFNYFISRATSPEREWGGREIMKKGKSLPQTCWHKYMAVTFSRSLNLNLIMKLKLVNKVLAPSKSKSWSTQVSHTRQEIKTTNQSVNTSFFE